jgi:hypothetical protein
VGLGAPATVMEKIGTQNPQINTDECRLKVKKAGLPYPR